MHAREVHAHKVYARKVYVHEVHAHKIIPSKRISKSPIGASDNIGREVGKREPRVQDVSHRLRLTNRWERMGG
jgi:hypothetical protein